MQIVNRKGAEDYLCKTSHLKCFLRQILTEPSRNESSALRHVFQIPLPHSEYVIDNVLVVYLVNIYVKKLCSCHVLTKEKCLLKDR